MKSKSDYIKLSVRSAKSLHDAEAVSKRPRFNDGYFVTSWTFPFVTKSQGAAALLAIQGKRKQLMELHPDVPASAFKLSTFRVGSIRGVPAIGYVSALESTETVLQAVGT